MFSQFPRIRDEIRIWADLKPEIPSGEARVAGSESGCLSSAENQYLGGREERNLDVGTCRASYMPLGMTD